VITSRDEQILLALTKKCRVMTSEQAARSWWGGQVDSQANATRRLRKLVRMGWLLEFMLFSRPLLALREPLVSWNLNNDAPSFNALAWKALSRWREPACRLPVFAASPRSLRHFGIPRRRAIKSPFQVTHDLHVTQVFLVYRQRWPDLASLWVGEDDGSSDDRSGIVPDARLLAPSGQAIRAIEFGGRYRADRLQAFHDGCVQRNLPYEVW
jgi:hypothetical protein